MRIVVTCFFLFPWLFFGWLTMGAYQEEQARGCQPPKVVEEVEPPKKLAPKYPDISGWYEYTNKDSGGALSHGKVTIFRLKEEVNLISWVMADGAKYDGILVCTEGNTYVSNWTTTTKGFLVRGVTIYTYNPDKKELTGKSISVPGPHAWGEESLTFSAPHKKRGK